jgi:prophage DNA circulation protein
MLNTQVGIFHMADIVISSFQKASFRGVPFLFTTNEQTGGRKYKIFEFPNADQRYTQDLGKLQKTYNMNVIIADNTFSYKNSKQRLLNALEQEGAGTLVHPTDGVKQVFATPYILDEAISHTGTAVFKVTFVETGKQLYPTQAASYSANLAQQLNAFIYSLNQDFSNIWAASANFQGNFQYSANLIEGVVDQFINAGNLVTNNITAYNNYVDEYLNLNSNRFRYTNSPSIVTSSVQSLFSLAGQLNSDNTQELIIFGSFFNYLVTPILSSFTVWTDERELNRLVITQLINSQALTYYYYFISLTNFDTTADINTQHEILNDQFLNIVNNNIYTDVYGNNKQILSNSTLSTLEKMRFNAHQSLNSKTVSTKQIIDISIKNESLLSLVFKYYGDVSNYDDIYNLNNLYDATNLKGDFKVLSDGN